MHASHTQNMPLLRTTSLTSMSDASLGVPVLCAVLCLWASDLGHASRPGGLPQGSRPIPSPLPSPPSPSPPLSLSGLRRSRSGSSGRCARPPPSPCPPVATSSASPSPTRTDAPPASSAPVRLHFSLSRARLHTHIHSHQVAAHHLCPDEGDKWFEAPLPPFPSLHGPSPDSAFLGLSCCLDSRALGARASALAEASGGQASLQSCTRRRLRYVSTA